MKKSEKGFTLVELLVVIAILGILMVALVPNIMDAITKSQMQTMAKQGSDIVNNLNISESSRSLWPRAEAASSEGTSDDEIYTKAYTSSTDYFKDLFDVENQNSGEGAQPYVDGVKIENLWGNGVSKASPGSLTKENVAWTILAGANGMNSDIPALITRNADTSQFPVSGQNDMSQKREKINLESKFMTPFGKKGCIVITKNGAALPLPARQCRLCDIYERQTSVNIPASAKLKYLEP